jgi:membrane associated rhomboid family serine protease
MTPPVALPALPARRLFAALLPRRIPFACLALTAVQLAIFLGEERWGGSTFHVTLMRMGAEFGPASLGAEAWRLLTAGYLHLGWQHLVGNAVLLLLCGMYLEGLLGPSRLVLLYTLCLLASTLAGALVLPQLLVVGSSGGVCGMVGALLALTSRPGAPLPPGRRLVCVLAASTVVASIVQGACACPQQMPSNILHLAGGAMGLGLGMSGALLWRLPRPGEAERLSVRVGAFAVAYITLLCMTRALVLGHPWEVRWAQPLVRLRMPGTPVTVAVPTGAARRAEVLEDATGGGASSRVFFGDEMKEPVSVEVTAERLERAMPEARLEEATRELRERLLEEAQGPQEPGSVMWSMPRVYAVDGHPAVYASMMAGNLFWVTRWSMYRDDWLITLEVWSASSGLPESWEPVGMEVVRSVAVEKEGEVAH